MGIFYVNWAIYARQHFVTDLPASKLTKVTYAFANVNATTGNVFLSDEWADVQIKFAGDVATNGTEMFGNMNQLLKLKKQNRNLKTSLSIGGWTYRDNFKTALASNATRWNFVQSSVAMVADLGFDGVNIDWEYPEDKTDAKNLVETVKLLRTALDQYAAKHADGYHFQIDVSAPAGPLKYTVMPIAAMDPYIDEWNLMAFDYMGPGFSNFTGHLSNVYPSTRNPKTTDFNTAQAIKYYKSKVASSRKVILGMLLYGRSFADTNGMGQKFNGSGDGTWEAGTVDYKSLPLNGSVIHTDRETVASWAYNNQTRQLISFDTPEVQALKAKYLKKEKLGGAWWWESSGDRADDKSLVSTVSNALGGTRVLQQNRNCIHYPVSKYDNVRRST
ncbi:glycoside hydrolase family 18 protein [Dothidotthia symphoricarpi CBS 119687]|uniref:chitinase n=1 Tax=Dothidotthia symphoricarpi CBS 119687 TaxID=1392245 RepID=A0A6A6A694_9PLEO|nr:glycoside hydrolase family 18 protein [Dothidotthia symphoricarpi CBS 119687]KAF2126141.1 glycoside hydrolase family 18 protein [Dothidotthia symphoricarpi CBS 119687]